MPSSSCLPCLPAITWTGLLPQRGHVFLEGSHPSHPRALLKVEKSSWLPTLPLMNRELLSGPQGGVAPCFS